MGVIRYGLAHLGSRQKLVFLIDLRKKNYFLFLTHQFHKFLLQQHPYKYWSLIVCSVIKLIFHLVLRESTANMRNR